MHDGDALELRAFAALAGIRIALNGHVPATACERHVERDVFEQRADRDRRRKLDVGEPQRARQALFNGAGLLHITAAAVGNPRIAHVLLVRLAARAAVSRLRDAWSAPTHSQSVGEPRDSTLCVMVDNAAARSTSIAHTNTTANICRALWLW